MKTTFFNAEGHRVKAQSAQSLRLRSFFKPGERGSRRYPFKVGSWAVAGMRAKHIGEDVCCDVDGMVMRMNHKTGEGWPLYVR